jgi:hypothetical protein
MSDTGIGGHHSARSRTDEWLTPPEIIDALGGAGSFDLDPCSPIARPWPTAREHYTIRDNGLIKPWHGRVYLCPPYQTSVIGKWLARMAEHNRGVSLLFARTETDAFFSHIWERAAALLFLRTPRLHFHYVDGSRAKNNCGGPSVLCAFGPSDAEILAFCGLEGQFVPLLLPRLHLAVVVDQTWAEALHEVFAKQPGPVPLAELYRAFTGHPKTRGNQNWREKIRQVLKRAKFRRVRSGVWELAA